MKPLLLLLALAACGPVRGAVLTVTGHPAVGCTPDAERCDGLDMQVCSATGRWWTSGTCAQACAFGDTTAHVSCVAWDAGVGQ